MSRPASRKGLCKLVHLYECRLCVPCPNRGKLAVVRQRRYVVTDVRSGVSGAQIADQPQHLVSLTSIEDDALGEELQVIWEIEPGAFAS